jgi:hypothetical protein
MNCDLLIDFDEEEIHIEKPIINYDKKYNEYTTKLYRNMRELKYNVISHNTFDCDINTIFKFHHMWDPYTGERTEIDPFGPLCFHPDELIHFFYTRRLKMLWNEPKDEQGGFYEGYYGDAVGSGEEINIPGRGIHPELYLFRLPIDDCYLPPDNDLSIITMGPKLTDEEIMIIEKLANKYHLNNYQNWYKKKRPSLSKIKKLYDVAISNKSDEKSNREAINGLIQM